MPARDRDAQPAPVATGAVPDVLTYAEATIEFEQVKSNLEDIVDQYRAAATAGDDLTLWKAELARGIAAELSHDWAAAYAAQAIAMLAESQAGVGDRR